MPSSEKSRTFGRYEVVRPLGRGAVGEVFLARDPALGRQVAVKTLSGLDGLPVEEQAEARARFLREARAAAGLSHPHIVTIHDVGEAEGGIPFLAMEYLRGTTLDRYTKPGHLLPAPKVLELGVQAAVALDEAHRHGIIHRDIKPANMVMLEDGTVKVADFGLAKGPDTGLTARETLLGTPNYMSPEQIAAKTLDGRSDLFSLAVSLFELLAGERPFGGDSVSSVLYRIVNDAPKPLASVCPDLPTSLGLFFERALAKDPDARPATAGEFAEQLGTILRSMGGVPANLRLPSPASASGSTPRPTTDVGRAAPGGAHTSRRWILLVVAAIVILAGGFVAWQVIAPGERTVLIETDPPGVAITVKGGAAHVLGTNTVAVPPRQAEPVVVEVKDNCRTGTLTLDPAQLPQRVRLVAAPRPFTLSVTSVPSGAIAQLDGAPQGTTPLSVTVPLCRASELRLSAPGRAPVAIALAADESGDAWQRRVTAIALPPATAAAEAASGEPAAEAPREGKVSIPAPHGYTAEVRLASGRSLGPAGKTFTLPAGTHRLVFVNRDVLLRRELSVTVRAGATETIDLEWPALGSLSVRAVPAGGRVLVRAQGEDEPVELGTTPLNQVPVVAGTYEVTIEHPAGGKQVVRTETVRGGTGGLIRVAQEDWR